MGGRGTGELGAGLGGSTTGMVTVYESLENVREEGVAGELGSEVIPARREVAAVAICRAGAIVEKAGRM